MMTIQPHPNSNPSDHGTFDPRPARLSNRPSRQSNSSHMVSVQHTSKGTSASFCKVKRGPLVAPDGKSADTGSNSPRAAKAAGVAKRKGQVLTNTIIPTNHPPCVVGRTDKESKVGRTGVRSGMAITRRAIEMMSILCYLLAVLCRCILCTLVLHRKVEKLIDWK